MIRIQLGDEVKDRVTGYKGIAVAHTRYLQGCDRFSVQASVDKDGKVPDWQSFDAPQLDVVKSGKVKSQFDEAVDGSPKKPGGPAKYIPLPKQVPGR
ncbi:MAG: hypothetical protein C4530_11460 [Desulfobacteraceae bacterium]|nr:MAG: hypothetical protein C4530_11460 [Desulfobacteraceae bacterium]